MVRQVQNIGFLENERNYLWYFVLKYNNLKYEGCPESDFGFHVKWRIVGYRAISGNSVAWVRTQNDRMNVVLPLLTQQLEFKLCTAIENLVSWCGCAQ